MPASASPPPSPPVRTPGQQPPHPASATNRSRTPQNDRFALYSPRNPDRRWIRAKSLLEAPWIAHDLVLPPHDPRYIFTEPRVGFWMPKGKGTGWGAARGSLSAEGLELSASRPPRRIGLTKLVQVAFMAYRDGLMLS